MAWSLKLVLFCSHHAIWHTRNSTKFVRNWRICGDPLLRFLSFLPTHTSPGSSRSPRIYPWPLHAHVPLLSCIRNDVQTHTHTVLSDLSVYIVIVCTIYAAYIIVYIYIILYHQYIIYHIISIHIYLWHCRWWLITRGNYSIFRIVIIQKSMLVYVDFMNMQDM